jgi:hypothetical protein
MKRITTKINEHYFHAILFYVFLAANLTPLFFTYFVGSLDGPKHLQIANIITELWKGNDLFADYFELSPKYTANIFGHYFLASLMMGLPAWLAEKLLLSFYVILLATGLRYLIFSITKKPGYSYFLIFPLTYTSLFLMGYYNYSIAFGFLFFSVGYYIRNYSNMSWLRVIKLMVLILLTYYTHFFVYGFLIFTLGAYTLHDIFICYLKRGKIEMKPIINKLKKLVLAALPTLILSVAYLKLILEQPTSDGGNEFNRWAYLSEFRILMGFVPSEELPMTRFLFWVILILVLYIAGTLLFKYIRTKQASLNFNVFHFEKLFWGFMVFTFFGFYFLMPNNLNSSGNILPRILIMALYLLLVWLSIYKTNFLVNLSVIVAILYYTSTNYSIHVKYRQQLDKIITELKIIEDVIPSNSIIMNCNYLDSWNMYHFQSYIGIDKPLLNINSKAISPLFSVKWREDRPQTFIGAKYSDSFSSYMNLPNVKGTAFAEYVTVVGKWRFENLSNDDSFKSLILRDYIKCKDVENPIVELYSLRIEEDLQVIMDRIKKDKELVRRFKESEKVTKVPFEDFVLRESIWIYEKNK